MKLKTALFLVVALTFQPTLAGSESSWYEDPVVWATIGVAAAVSYFVGGRFKEGVKNVLPALLGSTVFVGTVAVNMGFRKFDRSYAILALSVLVMGSILIYKALIICPVKQTQGCTCHLSGL